MRNGGGRHLSSEAICPLQLNGKEKINSTLLVVWTREHIQLQNTCLLLLCGTTIMSATSLSLSLASSLSLSLSEPTDVGTPKHKRERSLQILDGHPGIMELIGDCVGLIRGNEFRMLQEFNELVIEYNNTSQSSSDDDDDDDDDHSESTSDDDNDNDN